MYSRLKHPRRRPLVTLHGVVFDILVGAASALRPGLYSTGTPFDPRVTSLAFAGRPLRCALGGTTSVARPTQARNRIVSQVLSISHQRWPWRAERGSAWWL